MREAREPMTQVSKRTSLPAPSDEPGPPQWNAVSDSAESIGRSTLPDGTFELHLSPTTRSIEFVLDGTLAFALFDSGVLQTSPSDRDKRTLSRRLERFYTVVRGAGCVSVDLRDTHPVAASITHINDHRVRLVVTFAAGDTPSVVRVRADRTAVPGFARDSAKFSDPLDEQTHFTALWANQVGTLGSVDVPGSVYPTLKLPEREYWSLNTFFDPDSWSVINCLSFSGDEYLVAQARQVLERVRSDITADGLVPHHYDSHEPIYVAISGATQPGPNIFYCLAVLDHVAATGDRDFLRALWGDTLVPCVDALLGTLDSAHDLLRSGGPLWIDVFRREGITLDTNAAVVLLLGRMIAAAMHLGETVTADRWRAIRDRISAAVEGFWCGDHYATVLPGTGDELDMLDSDDVLVVLAGIADDIRARVVFDRLESSGMHPGGRGTWVSARHYGPELCYEGNVGDSSCAFARIWWAEMRARRDRGDRAVFLAMFEAVRADLIEHTWMGERYDENGAMTRADGYHEYPGVLDILLREGVYGIVVDVASVDVRPLRSADMAYRVGDVGLERTGTDWWVTVPGERERSFRFHDLAPGDRYRWDDEDCTVSADGTLVLTGQAGVGHTLTGMSMI